MLLLCNIKSVTLDQLLSLGNIAVSIIIAFVTYLISTRLSIKNKYDHEIYISNQLRVALGRKIILADVRKYNSDNNDLDNSGYYKQACLLKEIIPVYGAKVLLRDSKDFKLGIIPFDWIEYVRPYDSEDYTAIAVCKFKGVKWYKNFKSPIKKIIKS